MIIKNNDIIIIGSGLSGVTVAERYARILNKKVLILEKRNHIGGNCYDYMDEDIKSSFRNMVPIYFIPITKKYGITFKNFRNGYLGNIKYLEKLEIKWSHSC